MDKVQLITALEKMKSGELDIDKHHDTIGVQVKPFMGGLGYRHDIPQHVEYALTVAKGNLLSEVTKQLNNGQEVEASALNEASKAAKELGNFEAFTRAQALQWSKELKKNGANRT